MCVVDVVGNGDDVGGRGGGGGGVGIFFIVVVFIVVFIVLVSGVTGLKRGGVTPCLVGFTTRRSQPFLALNTPYEPGVPMKVCMVVPTAFENPKSAK